MVDFVELILNFEKATKNMFVFVDNDDVLGRVYINKKVLKEMGYECPDNIRISIDLE